MPTLPLDSERVRATTSCTTSVPRSGVGRLRVRVAVAAAVMVGIAVAVSGCASVSPPPAPQACADGAQSALHDALYFGTATPTGRVSGREWAEFLREAVTPRFPQGLSAWEAAGQWQGADGRIVREASHVLRLVHPADAGSEQALREIVATYKQRFRQEAVLRVRTQACISL